MFRIENKKKGYLAIIILCAIISIAITLITSKNYSITSLLTRFLYILVIELIILSIIPANPIHRVKVDVSSRNFKIANIILFLVLIGILFAGMSANPLWDGHTRDQLTQYEELSTALINGHLYIDHGDISQDLLNMENPYDYDARNANNIDFSWDHAFYNNHYYMYFGVVPCLLLFVPFELLTGHSLFTLHATMFLVAIMALGMFFLFRLIVKTYSKNMTVGMYYSILIGLIAISSWFIIRSPALYCTAISAGVCFAVWGFYFIFKSLVLGNPNEKSFWINLIIGSVFTALVFGCRPTIGLFCITYIPIWIMFLRNNDYKTTIKAFTCFLVPFIIIGACLALYNYVRFGNPMEFGQSYQLTIADQSTYSKKPLNIITFLNGIRFYLFKTDVIGSEFPYIGPMGLLIQFPIFIVMFLLLLEKKVITEIRKKQITYILLGLIASLLVIIAIQTVWSPRLLWRYSMDFNFILCIIFMIIISIKMKTAKTEREIKYTSTIIYILCILAIIVTFLLYFFCIDFPIQTGNPELFEMIKNFITLK